MEWNVVSTTTEQVVDDDTNILLEPDVNDCEDSELWLQKNSLDLMKILAEPISAVERANKISSYVKCLEKIREKEGSIYYGYSDIVGKYYALRGDYESALLWFEYHLVDYILFHEGFSTWDALSGIFIGISIKRDVLGIKNKEYRTRFEQLSESIFLDAKDRVGLSYADDNDAVFKTGHQSFGGHKIAQDWFAYCAWKANKGREFYEENFVVSNRNTRRVAFCVKDSNGNIHHDGGYIDFEFDRHRTVRGRFDVFAGVLISLLYYDFNTSLIHPKCLKALEYLKNNPSEYLKEDIELLYKEYESKKKKGCYVATCVYGTYDCPEVWILRRFRDFTLDKSVLGRLFIKTYYKFSPNIVARYGDNEIFRRCWRSVLDRMVKHLLSKGVSDTPYKDKYWFVVK